MFPAAEDYCNTLRKQKQSQRLNLNLCAYFLKMIEDEQEQSEIVSSN